MEHFRADLVEVAASLLDTLGRSLGVDLTLDETGAVYFDHADGWHVGLMLAGTDQIVVAVAVASEQYPQPEQLATILTDFNWLGARAAGAALGYNPERGSFVLWKSVDVTETTAEQLNRMMLRLVESAGPFRKTLISERRASKTDEKLTDLQASFGARV